MAGLAGFAAYAAVRHAWRSYCLRRDPKLDYEELYRQAVLRIDIQDQMLQNERARREHDRKRMELAIQQKYANRYFKEELAIKVRNAR